MPCLIRKLPSRAANTEQAPIARGTIPRCRQYVSALDLGGEATAKTSQWQPERCNGSARSGTKAEIWRALLRCETAERTPATLFPSESPAVPRSTHLANDQPSFLHWGRSVACHLHSTRPWKAQARYDVGGTWHKLEAEPGRLGLLGPCSDFSTSLAIIFPAKALVRTAPPSPTFDLDSIILSSPLFLIPPS